MTTQQSRTIQALSIVCKFAGLQYFPADKLDKRIPAMRFGQVVRQTNQLVAAGFGNLMLCCKGLHQESRRHEQTYRILRLRLNTTFDAASLFVGYIRCPRPTLEQRDAEGMTDLMRAIYRIQGDIVRARALIDLGAHVNAKGEYGSVLTMAVGLGNAETVKLLRDAGADIQGAGHESPPLFEAAKSGHAQIIAYLISARCDVNVRNNLGQTALWATVIARRPQITWLLLNHKADPTLTCHDGTTVFDMARNYNSPVLQVLERNQQA
jgi:ankyrin repeat protein